MFPTCLIHLKHTGKLRRERTVLSLSIVSSFLLLLLAACSTGVPVESQSPGTQTIAPTSANVPSWFARAKKQSFLSHGQYIAAEAIAVASALCGTQTNEYYTDDPAMTEVIAYWKRACQNADGSLCADAQSGNLQCVEFVSGVFAMIDDELPYGADANQFWQLYQGKSNWREIPVTSVPADAPALGDMMVWSGNASGHLAIVVDQQAPTKESDGYIEVAQANAANAFERLTWHTNGQIDSWSSYQLQGFIRQQEIAPCLRPQATPLQEQWETLAIEAAVQYGIPSKYFLRQLCQSGFRSEDQQGHPLVSSTGAIGIAQLPESIAAHIPRCVINFVANAPNCDRFPGSLPAGSGIDPMKPVEALPAAAYEMSALYSHYLHHKSMQMPQDEIAGYKMALAAYNAGAPIVDKALNACGKMHWLGCLDRQQKDHSSKNYISIVLKVMS